MSKTVWKSLSGWFVATFVPLCRHLMPIAFAPHRLVFAQRWASKSSQALLLLCLCGLFAGKAFSQLPNHYKVMGKYQQFIWQEQQGLPQNTVQTVVRTRDGYLWMGTLSGVARFDGAHFTVFDNSNTSAIKGSYITALLEDRQGDLWMTSDGGGLLRYHNGNFNAYFTRDHLPSDTTRVLLEDLDGSIWIGTYGGLARFKDESFTVYRKQEGLPDDFIQALAQDSDGNLWAGTKNGLARWRNGTFTNYTTDDGLPHNSVNALCWDQQHRLWVGTNSGLCRLEGKRFLSTGAVNELAHTYINKLYQDRYQNLWIGTIGRGLFRWQGRQLTQYSTKEGLPGDRVTAIYEDPEGDLWVGTDGGLSQLKIGRFQTYTIEDGLSPDFVSAVYEDTAGNLWIGSTNGLHRFKDGEFTAYKASAGMPAKYIRSICEDQAGNLWIGSDGGGLTTFQNGKFTTWTSKDGLSGDAVTAVLQDRAGHLWIGTYGTGLNLFRDGRFTVYNTQNGLPDNYIRALFEDRDGNLWIGTQSGGLVRLRDGQFTTWTTQDGLPCNFIVSFFEDPDGNLWIGTVDGGLSRFRDGKFANVAAKDGLYDNVAFQMLPDTEDDSASLWMSCNKGIYRVSLKELNDFADGRISSVTSFIYGLTDGMLSRECNSANPGGWKTRDGKLWFPTTRGLVSIDPQSRSAQAPLLEIERVSLDQQVLPTGQLVVINSDQENLEIQYTGLSWNRPQHLRFKYKLLGLDKEWVEAGSRRIAYYPHLPPGEYTFTVIADNGEGVWNREGKKLRILVLPPFYRTGWFLALIGLMVIGLATLAYQIRVRQLTRAKAAQETFSRQLIASQENERKRIAGELHDSLGQNLLMIKNWVTMAKRFLEPESRAREPLDEVASVVSLSIKEVRDISYNLRPYHLDEMGLTEALHFMLERIAEASGIRFTVEIDPLDRLLSSESEINLYRVIQECANNIVKHSQASEAKVFIHRDSENLVIVIKDNGKGFEIENVLRDKAHGFGLMGIAERARLLGGKETIQSAHGAGTIITITMRAQKGTHE
jgi:ligand-binding sensor domain-containing protein/signal transduction histidine kinase